MQTLGEDTSFERGDEAAISTRDDDDDGEEVYLYVPHARETRSNEGVGGNLTTPERRRRRRIIWTAMLTVIASTVAAFMFAIFTGPA